MNLWLSLYPRSWRERYGPELEAHLAEEGLTWRARLDLLAGAIDARMHPNLAPAPTPVVEGVEGVDGTRSPLRSLFCDRRGSFPPAAQRRSALLMILTSLAVVGVALGHDLWRGDSVYSQTLLYAGFNIGLVVSGLPTVLAVYPRPVRACLVFLGISASYLFFLAVTLLARAL